MWQEMTNLMMMLGTNKMSSWFCETNVFSSYSSHQVPNSNSLCPIFFPHYCPLGTYIGRPISGFWFFGVWSENFLHGEHYICPQQAFVQCIYRLLFLHLFCTFCCFGNTIYFVIFIYLFLVLLFHTDFKPYISHKRVRVYLPST